MHYAEGRSGKTAILPEDRSLTYTTFRPRLTGPGNALLKLGIQKEQRVVLVLPDVTEFTAAYFGAIRIGALRPADGGREC